MEEMKSKVYALPDSSGRILRIEGQYSLPEDLTGWVLIEEGAPCDRLNLAQSHFVPDGIYTEDGIPKYKLVDDVFTQRGEEEIEADRAERIPANQDPTIEERVGVLEIDAAETKEALIMILEGVTEDETGTETEGPGV